MSTGQPRQRRMIVRLAALWSIGLSVLMPLTTISPGSATATVPNSMGLTHTVARLAPSSSATALSVVTTTPALSGTASGPTESVSVTPIATATLPSPTAIFSPTNSVLPSATATVLFPTPSPALTSTLIPSLTATQPSVISPIAVSPTATVTPTAVTTGSSVPTPAHSPAHASIPVDDQINGTQETIMVPFVDGITGVQTSLSYTGSVTITVSGVGQASGTDYSDAFYIYTDLNGNPVQPVHYPYPPYLYDWTLWINGGPADLLVQPIPAYNSSHIYTFSLTAPGGPLTFAVGDTLTSDNTGAYTVVITSGSRQAASSGTIPWHPHQTVHLSDHMSASVDLSDGHLDLSASDMSIPALGPDLSLEHTWDSVLAQQGVTTTAGAGWVSSLTPTMGGTLTGTVVYTDASGATWPFTYTGNLTAPSSYSTYQTTPGLPWQLTTSSAGYTLTNILTSERLTFTAQGQLRADTDAYGNTNTFVPSTGAIRQEQNSGGRALTFSSTTSGLLSDVVSPLFTSSQRAQGQHVAYGYGGDGAPACAGLSPTQLCSITWGAGTSDAMTARFGYSGTLLTSVTTPYTEAVHTWTIAYDAQNRIQSITSPISGTMPSQAGYTPAYTTLFTYNPNQTVVVEGYGSTKPVTTSYSLDGAGEATAVQDALLDTTYNDYDADHDITTTTDADGNTTRYAYAYVGPPGSSDGLGSIGLVTQTVKPPITVGTFTGDGPLTPVTTTNAYSPTTYDLITTTTGTGGVTFYTYDGHHSVVTTTQLVETQPLGGPGCAALPPSADLLHNVAHQAATGPAVFCWRGSVNGYNQQGERITTIDGRGLGFQSTTASLGTNPQTIIPPAFTPSASQEAAFTTRDTYTPQGDLQSESTPPITTTLPDQNPAVAPATTTYGYDADGNQTSMLSANGHALGNTQVPTYTTSYAYDHLGRPIRTTDPGVRLYTGQTAHPVESTAYDGEGNVVFQEDGNGDITTSSYDPLGREVATTDPVSGTTIMTYTAVEKSAAQDPQGNVTTYSYDPAARVILTVDPAGETTQQSYDPVGNTTAITTSDASGIAQIETTRYDGWNQVISDTISGPPTGPQTTPQTTLTAYDQDGNVVEVQNPNGDVIENRYDLTDQQNSTAIAPANHAPVVAAETTTYDPAGNVHVSTDFTGRTDTASFDPDNRLVQSVDTSPSSDSAAPSSVDTTATDTTLTTVSDFDPDGNVITQSVTPPVSGAAAAALEDTASVSRNNADTDAYNAADWTRKTTDNPPSRQILTTGDGYDGAGQQRVLTVPDPFGSSVAANADDATNPDTVPQGSSFVTLALNADGLVTATTEGISSTTLYTSTDAYNMNDLPVTTTVPGGVQQVAQYDPSSRLTTLTASGPTVVPRSATLNSTYGYGYDGANWTTAMTTTINGLTTTQLITHDGSGQVTSVQSSSGTQSWTYDANGNISTNVTAAGTTNYGYAPSIAPNELFTVTAPGVGATYYTYDNNGNTTTITNTMGVTHLGYDSQARLTSVTLGNGTVVALGYNSESQRSSYSVTPQGVSRPTLIETFTYRTDGTLGQVAVITGTQRYTDTYLYTQSGAPLELLRAQNGMISRYWYVLDGRDDVVALTDVNGHVVDRYSYDVWGQPTSVSETVPQRLRYAGYWWDQELGWYWLSVRMYDPSLKRWLQTDPSEIDGVHTYVYVGDDPVDTSDPSGLVCYGSVSYWFDGRRASIILPDFMCSSPAPAVLHAVDTAADKAYGVLIQPDIDTIKSPTASPAAKAWAVADLVLTIVPIPAGKLVKGGEFSYKFVKGVAEGATHLRLPPSVIEAAVNLLRDGGGLAAQCALCFPANTLVATPGGEQDIQTLHVGDLVLAENPLSGTVEAEPVQALIQDPISPLIAVELSDGSSITVTADHPFWVELGHGGQHGEWLEAGQLWRGMRLRTVSGTDILVVGIHNNVGHAAVYTLTVPKDHTYFVGTARVLVHNSSGNACKKAVRALWTITRDLVDKDFIVGNQTYLRDAKTGLWWSRDTAGHGGSAWKVFEQRGKVLHWIADADEYGNYILGKHKGPVGLTVRIP